MATWYVRPGSSHGGTNAGTSYANAWQGGPLAAQNAMKGYEQWTQGYAQDVGGVDGNRNR